MNSKMVPHRLDVELPFSSFALILYYKNNLKVSQAAKRENGWSKRPHMFPFNLGEYSTDRGISDILIELKYQYNQKQQFPFAELLLKKHQMENL